MPMDSNDRAEQQNKRLCSSLAWSMPSENSAAGFFYDRECNWWLFLLVAIDRIQCDYMFEQKHLLVVPPMDLEIHY